MALNPFFQSETITQGSMNEQMLLADLVEESIQMFGQEFLYIPRKLVAKDEILGEDRLSTFERAIPIEMYVETPQGFLGQGEFVQKFGLYIEQSIQVSMSKRRWATEVGRTPDALLPERPAEGDLVFSPFLKRIFEIKYVDKEVNFYQLGSLPMWKMTLELFQYSSERLDTGVPDIDVFEDLKTFDTTLQPDIDLPEDFGDNNKFKQEANNIVFNESNPFGE